jgi:hypothetical protein
MLKRLTPSEQISILLDQYSQAVQAAFLRAVADIRSTIVLQLVVDKLVQHDIEGAVRALNIDAPAFNPVLDEIAKAFNTGGNGTIDAMPPLRSPDGHRLVLRFDVRDPVAEQRLRQHSTTLVTNIVSDQMTALRESMSAGLAQLQHPRAIALDIVGRKSTATGQRVGGIIGLTSPQAAAVRAYREELQSGDGNALARKLRDRRFDKAMRTALDAGKVVPADTAAKMATAYESRLLKLRGETLSRTETAAALGASSEEAMRQNIAKGYVPATLVDQKWNTIMDGRERHTHAALNGQVVGWGESFTSPSGARLRYPGDPSAPASEIIGCRCNRTFVIRKQGRVLH